MRYLKALWLWPLLFSLLLPLSANGGEQVVLQLKWKHQFQFAGFYMAKEKGYFEQAGLNVEIKEVQTDKNTLEILTNGDADYAVVDPGVLIPIANGAPIKIIAAIFQHSPLALIVRDEAAITRLSDLRGKRIMMVPGLNADIEAALAKAGVSPSDFIRQQISFDINDLVNGNTDAFAGYITDQPHQLEMMGVRYRVFHPKDEGIDFYGDILVTTEMEATSNQDRVVSFKEASMLGWEYALTHIDETIDLIQSKYNSQNLPRKQLLFEALKTKEMILGDVVAPGYMSDRRWEKITATYQKFNLIPANFSVTDAIFRHNPSFTDQIRANIWPISLFLLITSLLFMAVHTFRLRQVVRQRTEKLLNSEQLLKSAQSIAHLGSWQWDIKNNSLCWSDEVYRIFDTDPQSFDATIEGFLSFIHPDDRDTVKHHIDNALTGQPYAIEHRINLGDGRERIVLEQGIVEFRNNQPFMMTGTVHDITEQKELDQALNRSAKMEAMVTLIGGIAHNFNNRMAGIMGNIFLAKKEVEKSSKISERLNTIESSSLQMAELIKQLVTFTQGELHQNENIDINDCIRKVCEAYTFPEGIAFYSDLSDKPLPVFGSAEQIEQVITKILDNAVEAVKIASHPQIQIKSDLLLNRNIMPEAQGQPDAGQLVHVQITDNGVGIPEENLEHIFEPFFTTKHQALGEGLGLSVAIGIIHNHKGTIQIKSSPELGTTVHIHLPKLN